ncbi:helix-turn-helix transcriptional regulator [Clostridium sp. ZBS4]|uniref:helix-turn-helix domain-containing protein n=1 Tax=Clostridium sp. ZBS4 TaxID=2949974 RepID=UPI002079D007|nr:helix-turn-helix transcriptional regulator [Clostridium sp. ZBS4]
MDKTEKLKHIILSKYNSIREFAKIVEIPSTTLTSALDKGVGGMAVDRIIKICEVLNIDIKTFEPINDSSENNLSKEETTLLENYNKLNDLGKKEANKRVAELTEINKYIAKKENNIINLSATKEEEEDNLAAHDDNLDSETAKKNLNKAKEIFKQMDEE